VLAAYNWAPNTERGRKLARFVDAFFTKFPALQNPPFHPKWKEVSLSAQLAGWNRLPLAQQWLDKQGVVKQRFDAFLQETPGAANIQSAADKEALFRQFEAWEAGRNARAQLDPQVDSKQVDSRKARNRDHASRSATKAGVRSHASRRSHAARRAAGPLTEQRAVAECEGYRDRAAPDACKRASEETWWRPFPGTTPPPGATQGISTTDRPSSDFTGRQPVLR
jgi:hypothetical protein